MNNIKSTLYIPQLAWTALAAASLGPSIIATASAADSSTLEEVVVTAERREATLQDTALSIAVVGGDQLQQKGVTNLMDALQSVPTVQVQNTVVRSENGPAISIRGVGSDGLNKQQATATYIDGIAIYGENGFYYDLDRVEVLSGPQGTLYGGTATGGAVNFITNKPELNAMTGSVTLGGGNHDSMRGTGILNAPIGETFAVRVAVDRSRHDHPVDSSRLEEDRLDARVKALWQPNDDFSLLLGVSHYQDKGNPEVRYSFASDGDLIQAIPLGVSEADKKQNKFWAEVNWNVGIGTLTYLPAFQKRSLYSVQDSVTPAARQLITADIPSGEGELWSHELRLASNPESEISWVGGLYYFKEDQYSLGTVVLNLPGATPVNGFNVNIITEDFVRPTHRAAFGQVTVPLGETTRITGGLRYSEDKVEHPQNFVTCIFGPCNTILYPFEKTFTSLDYLARVEKDLTPDNLVYFSASSGYRPGNLAQSGNAYDNEKLRAWELGSKNRLLDGALTLNGSVFYYDYPKYQSATNIAGGPLGSGREMEQLFYTEVLPVEYYGVEVQATWALTPVDIVTIAPTWLHTRFKENAEFPEYFGGPVTVVETEGEPVPRAPSFAVDASYQHIFRLGDGGEIFASFGITYKSEQVIDFSTCYYSPSPDSCDTAIGGNPAINQNPATHTQDAYTLYGVSTGWTSSDDRWKVSLYGRNLGDTRYKLLYNGGALTVGTGRNYGLTLSRSW